MRGLLLAVAMFCCVVLHAQQTSQLSVDAVFAGAVRMNGYASGVAIEWLTADESAVDYFAVLRHTDLRSDVVATMEPRGRVDTVTSYRYIDQSEFTHDLSFSVRVVFLDGTFADSEQLLAQTAHSRRTRILRALDQESLASLRIQLDSDHDQNVSMKIMSLSGETLDTYQRRLLAGVNTVEIDYGSWPAGYYRVEMIDDSQEQLAWLVRVDPDVPLASTRKLPSRS